MGGGEGRGLCDKRGEGCTVAMTNMPRHLGALCMYCSALCNIDGEALLVSPTSTARAHRLQHGRVGHGESGWGWVGGWGGRGAVCMVGELRWWGLTVPPAR